MNKDESERNYCNILDLLAKDGQLDLIQLLGKLCLISLFTGRSKTQKGFRSKTFMLMPVAAIKKIAKMKDDDAKEVIKRHIFLGVHTMETLKEKSGKTLFSMTKDNFEIGTGGKSIGDVKVKGEITGANNGIILKIGSMLPETDKVQRKEQDAPKSGGSKRRTRRTRKTRTRKMRGGGLTVNYITHPLLSGDINYRQNLNSLSGIDLRWNMLEHHRRKWPLMHWDISDNYNHYAWAYASLILYLRESIPDFYSVYEPFTDPVVGLEHLLQYRLVNSNKYLLSDSILHGWNNSKYWLLSDPVILKEAQLYTLGGGKPEMSGGLGHCVPITQQSQTIINAYRQPYLSSMLEVLDNKKISEQDKRMYIVDVYKQIETDDKFRDSRSRKLYKKLDSDLWLVTLGTHLDAYLTHTSIKLINKPFAGGKNIKGGSSGKITMFDEFKCAFGSLGYRNMVDLVLQPQLTSGYRFSLDFFKNFCTSPFCIYVAGLNKPLHRTTLKSPYVKRRGYTDYAYPMQVDKKVAPRQITFTLGAKKPSTNEVTFTPSAIATNPVILTDAERKDMQQINDKVGHMFASLGVPT